MEKLDEKSLAELRGIADQLTAERNMLHSQINPAEHSDVISMVTNLHLRGRAREMMQWGMDVNSGDETKAKGGLIGMINLMKGYNQALKTALDNTANREISDDQPR